MGVPHIAVATGAGQTIRAAGGGLGRMDQIAVAMQTGLLRHGAIARLNSNRVGEVASGKSQGMEEAVIRLRHPLANGVMG